VNAGLLPAIRSIGADRGFRLHNEIRDLLLAYARHKKWLDAEAGEVLNKKLADSFAQRYRHQQQIQWLLERLYHEGMLEGYINLEPIKEPQLLVTMAIELEAEKQYSKISQIMLRLIDIQPDYENAWYGLGIALGQQGKFDDAIAAYRKQIETKPDHDNAWYNLGSALAGC